MDELSARVTREAFDAVLFDMDGVLTATAGLHAKSWKETFDAYLKSRPEPFVPFDLAADYRAYVDGKLRQDGVASFLGSRGIVLPMGEPSAALDEASVWGVANRKNRVLQQRLREFGVDVYEDTIRWAKRLRAAGFRIAVVSASRNCAAMLQAAGIEALFDARVDGVVAAELKLPGKPAPDTYLEAARRVGAPPGRAVVVEDAVSGVAAGAAGAFGLVVGVDRGGHAEALRRHGADIVVSAFSAD